MFQLETLGIKAQTLWNKKVTEEELILESNCIEAISCDRESEPHDDTPEAEIKFYYDHNTLGSLVVSILS
jgi:hypothetical protein